MLNIHFFRRFVLLVFLFASSSVTQAQTQTSVTQAQIQTSTADIPKHIHYLKAGGESFCAYSDLGVRCWGRTAFGVNADAPFDLKDIDLLEVAASVACATKESRLFCWGEMADPIMKEAKIENFKELALDEDVACAVDEQQMLHCWRANFGFVNLNLFYPKNALPVSRVKLRGGQGCALFGGQLGCWNLTINDSLKFYPQWDDLTDFALARDLICVLHHRQVECDGSTLFGIENVPTDLFDVKMFAISTFAACALTYDDQVHCWGSLPRNATIPSRLKPGVKQLVADWENFCAVYDDDLSCWGDSIKVPEPLKGVQQIAMNSQKACALVGDEVSCWDGGGISKHSLPSFKDSTQFIVSNEFICGIFPNGDVKCEKDNPYEYGLNTARLKLPVASFKSNGNSRVCSLAKSGKPTCLSVNEPHLEMLPSGTGAILDFALDATNICYLKEYTIDCWEPIQRKLQSFAYEFSLKSIAVSDDTVCGLGSDFLDCWSLNSKQRTRVLSGLKSPRSFSLGRSHGCLIDEGITKCWGHDAGGRVSIPNQEKDLKQIAVGGTSTCILRKNDEIECFGDPRFTHFPRRVF